MVCGTLEALVGSIGDAELDVPLMDSGLDSLSSLDFRNQLNEACGLRLPQTLVFDYPSPTAIMDYLAGKLLQSDIEPEKSSVSHVPHHQPSEIANIEHEGKKEYLLAAADLSFTQTRLDVDSVFALGLVSSRDESDTVLSSEMDRPYTALRSRHALLFSGSSKSDLHPRSRSIAAESTGALVLLGVAGQARQAARGYSSEAALATGLILKRDIFAWRQVTHPLLNNTLSPSNLDGEIVSETCFTAGMMQMYSDHRVFGQIIKPGVSHVGLIAAAGGMQGKRPVGKSSAGLNVSGVFFSGSFFDFELTGR
jgi:hypothetical protein